MYNLKTKNYRLQTEKGFTLLVAVLVSGVLMAIGLAIFNITIKEVLLSSTGRDSQFAFYAADSGIECALYWDLKGGGFSTTTDTSINCNDTPMTVGAAVYGVPTEFTFEVGGSFEVDGFCSIVEITKSETHPRTTIESKGYNTDCNDTVNPRRIERAIRATY